VSTKKEMVGCHEIWNFFFTQREKKNMDSSDIAITNKMLKCKWMYKIKYETNEGIEKYKACLVVKVVFKILELILMKLIP
jgi:hypothetical protein